MKKLPLILALGFLAMSACDVKEAGEIYETSYGKDVPPFLRSELVALSDRPNDYGVKLEWHPRSALRVIRQERPARPNGEPWPINDAPEWTNTQRFHFDDQHGQFTDSGVRDPQEYRYWVEEMSGTGRGLDQMETRIRFRSDEVVTSEGRELFYQNESRSPFEKARTYFPADARVTLIGQWLHLRRHSLIFSGQETVIRTAHPDIPDITTRTDLKERFGVLQYPTDVDIQARRASGKLKLVFGSGLVDEREAALPDKLTIAIDEAKDFQLELVELAPVLAERNVFVRLGVERYLYEAGRLQPLGPQVGIYRHREGKKPHYLFVSPFGYLHSILLDAPGTGARLTLYSDEKPKLLGSPRDLQVLTGAGSSYERVRPADPELPITLRRVWEAHMLLLTLEERFLGTGIGVSAPRDEAFHGFNYDQTQIDLLRRMVQRAHEFRPLLQSRGIKEVQFTDEWRRRSQGFIETEKFPNTEIIHEARVVLSKKMEGDVDQLIARLLAELRDYERSPYQD